MCAATRHCLHAATRNGRLAQSNPAGQRRRQAHFAEHLARCGLIITSGLAMVSMRRVIEVRSRGGTTIAVCGTGLDTTYPRSNVGAGRGNREPGARSSVNFRWARRPVKANFPRRNRIIGGPSLGTLVVEAAVQSGSLITARLAADQGREVFAIPGSIHNPMARGCHRLIRQGAKLVETADDIFDELRSMLGCTPEVSCCHRIASGRHAGNR